MSVLCQTDRGPRAESDRRCCPRYRRGWVLPRPGGTGWVAADPARTGSAKRRAPSERLRGHRKPPQRAGPGWWQNPASPARSLVGRVAPPPSGIYIYSPSNPTASPVFNWHHLAFQTSQALLFEETREGEEKGVHLLHPCSPGTCVACSPPQKSPTAFPLPSTNLFSKRLQTTGYTGKQVREVTHVGEWE